MAHTKLRTIITAEEKSYIALKMQLNSAAIGQHGHFYVTPRCPYYVFWLVSGWVSAWHLASCTCDSASIVTWLTLSFLHIPCIKPHCSWPHQVNFHYLSANKDWIEASEEINVYMLIFCLKREKNLCLHANSKKEWYWKLYIFMTTLSFWWIISKCFTLCTILAQSSDSDSPTFQVLWVISSW